MNAYVKEQVVLVEKVSQGVALVVINRPQASNAFNREVTQELDKIVKMVEADPEIQVAILTGAGDRAFCAGADLKDVNQYGLEALQTTDGGFAGFVNAKRSKVWIAAVNGAALAGGLELALACDLIIATSKAKFGLPEVKRGLVALAGGVIRLPRVIPYHIAKEMILTGEPIDTQRAYALGLINKIVEPNDLLTAAKNMAELIALNSPNALKASLNIANKTFDCCEEELFHLCKQTMAELITHPDYVEGPKAFIEKRRPVWQKTA